MAQVERGQGGLPIGWNRVEQGQGVLQSRWNRVEQWTGVCPAKPVYLFQSWTTRPCTIHCDLCGLSNWIFEGSEWSQSNTPHPPPRFVCLFICLSGKYSHYSPSPRPYSPSPLSNIFCLHSARLKSTGGFPSPHAPSSKKPKTPTPVNSTRTQ